jgi:exopolysaccharide production protein ExoZ
LAYPTLKKWRTNAKSLRFNVSDFAAKRLVRILPPFYLATLFFVAVALVAQQIGRPELLPLPSARDLAGSLLFFDGHIQLINSSFWTLMVEFRWYFLFPVCLALWLRSPRAFLLIGLGCVLLYNFTRARGVDLGTLPGFMLGIVAADIHAGARLPDGLTERIKRAAVPLAIACAVFGIIQESHNTIPGVDGNEVHWRYTPTMISWQLATFFLVVAAGSLRWLSRLLSWSALVAIGVASYGIYLVHEPILTVILGRFSGPLGFAAAAGIAVAAGFAFWAVGERPFTTGPLRAPLLAAVRRLIDRAFGFFGFERPALWLRPRPA